MIITINLDVPSMRSKQDAEDFACQVSEHIMDTFNDDRSIKGAYYKTETKKAFKKQVTS